MRSGVALERFFPVNPRRSVAAFAFFFAVLFSPSARADFSLPKIDAIDSASGQFIVMATPGYSPLDGIPQIFNDNDLVRLEPALLAVSAERVRKSVIEKLGISSSVPWSGVIYLVIRPARSLDENIEIVSDRFGNHWEYHVLLPDIVSRERLVRALTGALLLEYANRNATVRSAEVPHWLVEGLAEEVLADNLEDVILSPPDHAVNGLPYGDTDITTHGMDSLAGARQVFHDYSILTFQQLSWPTDAQLLGNDGGEYRASAQLFVDELLAMRDGKIKLCHLLQMLPRYYNWQTAFWSAFHENFTTPLQVEKWWALQSVLFDSRSPGPQWTPAVSREKLNEILAVPVEYRGASNSLPARAEISLQAVIRSFDSMRQIEILQTKLRDLEIAQLRMAPTLAILTAEYRNTLAAYLGQPRPTRGTIRVNSRAPAKITAPEALRMLDALDARRRAVDVATRAAAPY